MRKAIIIRTFFVFFIFSILSSCKTKTETVLYKWNNYDYAMKQYYEEPSDESFLRLYDCYTDIVTYPGGDREVPQPGAYADMAYLILDVPNRFPSTNGNEKVEMTQRGDSTILLIGSHPHMVRRNDTVVEKTKLVKKYNILDIPFYDRHTYKVKMKSGLWGIDFNTLSQKNIDEKYIAVILLRKEKELYPESSVFIDRILKLLSKD